MLNDVAKVDEFRNEAHRTRTCNVAHPSGVLQGFSYRDSMPALGHSTEDGRRQGADAGPIDPIVDPEQRGSPVSHRSDRGRLEELRGRLLILVG